MGRSAFGRVDVEDAAAEGELAGHFDDVDAGVADGEEVLDEHVGEVLLAGAEGEGEGGVEVGMEELEAGGFDGRDDEADGVGGAGAGGDLPEGGGAGLLDFGMGGEVFEGKDIVGGEADDGGGVERAGELAGGDEGLVEGLGGFVVGDEDEGGGGGGLDEEGQVEGARGEGEASDAAARLAVLEVAAGAVEGVGVFKVREEVADEGKDHAMTSL